MLPTSSRGSQELANPLIFKSYLLSPQMSLGTWVWPHLLSSLGLVLGSHFLGFLIQVARLPDPLPWQL